MMEFMLDAAVRETVLTVALVPGGVAVGLTVAMLSRALKRRGMGAND